MISNSVMTERLAELTTHNNMHKYEFAFIKICVCSVTLSLSHSVSSVSISLPLVSCMKNKTINFIWCFLYETRFDQHFYGQFHHFITMLYFNTNFTYHPVLLVYLFSSQDGDISSFGCNLQTYTNTFCYSSCLNFSIHKSIPINGNILYSHAHARTHPYNAGLFGSR